MRVAIVGSRGFSRPDLVCTVVQHLAKTHPNAIIVSGGAKGVDSWAAMEGRLLGLKVEEILPDWGKYGKAAGILRNTQILEGVERVYAFWDGVSRGTLDTITKAQALGLDVRVLTRRNTP